jgi:peptide deformylase
MSSHEELPEYVIINDPSCENRDVLRKPAEVVTFPLDDATLKIARHLENKFDQEENCAGLAAPQIGYSKRMIILEVTDDEEIKKFRTDLTDTLPKSIWVNPTWTALTDEKTSDWEACFSVDEVAGSIPRFTEISYEAWTLAGEKIGGKAKGFLARLIQHETDHINGKLFIDHIPEEKWVPREELRKKRER